MIIEIKKPQKRYADTAVLPNPSATIAGNTKIPAPITVLMMFEESPNIPTSFLREGCAKVDFD